MGKSRPQQWRIAWPLTAPQVESIDLMFETLFRTIRDVTVSPTQIIGIGSIVQGDIIYGTGPGTIGLLPKDINATRYLANTGTSNNPKWDQVNLANGVVGRLPYNNFTAATAASKLLGRGDSGAGDWQEITIGSNLTITGTTLSASASGGAFEPLTNGDSTFPELVFTGGGDVIMVPF